MSCKRSQIVAQARSWLGLKEADGSFKAIIDTYNGHKPRARGYKLQYSDEWCSGFASAVAIACGATDIIPTEVGCGKHIKLFQQMGIWVERDDYVPSPGDYIFYDWADDGKGENMDGASHVGIVETVENGLITVIEGNKNAQVARRVVKVNARHIRGYGVPRYDAEETPLPEVTYRVYADGRWLNEVTGDSDYAGIFGKEITGMEARLSDGQAVTVRRHTCSGWEGDAMDCIAMKAEGRKLKYRVHILGGKWLPWVSGFDTADFDQGFAGVYGKAIDAVQITVEQ